MYKKKILIADDDSGIVDALTLMLEMSGYEVDATLDGADVQSKIDAKRPDLLLLDIWMSGHDGGEICRTLKQTKGTEDLPVILVSANKDVAAIARDSGANDYIAKPFHMKDLIGKIEAYTSAPVIG